MVTFFPGWVKVLGITGLAGSFFLFFRSYTDNTFLSPLVRIQDDRRQRVVSTGVYGFVRHPMYLGGIFMLTGVPLLLGLWYGLFIGLALTGSSYGQDTGRRSNACPGTLRATGSMEKVRYHLIPHIW